MGITTIQIDDDVKQKLAKHKDGENKTYNAVIKKMLKLSEPSIMEMYGKYPDLPEWNKDRDRMQDRENKL
jgi:predicted CopG family antitoxin